MRFAIIGAGAISQLRKSAIGALPGSTLVGVADIDHERAAALAGDAKVYAGIDEIAADEHVDSVIVCTPPNTHEELACKALAAGKHVLVEKPMANSLAACERMVAAARDAGRVLTVGFNHRYFPAIKMLKDAVSGGEIGTVSHVRGYAGHVGLAEFKSKWMYSHDVMGGGALMDNGIHMIDLVHHVLGPVSSVTGRVGTRIWDLEEVEDNAYAVLNARDGSFATLGASWSEWRGYHFFVEVYGNKGMARAYYAPMTFTLITMPRPGGPSTRRTNRFLGTIFAEKFRGWQVTAVQTFTEELSDFIALADRATDGGRIATAEDGFRSIEIANAVYSSSQSSEAVRLRETV